MFKNKPTIFVLLSLSFFCILNISYAQQNEIDKVLKKNVIDRKYVFDYSTKKDGLDKITIIYLGHFKTDSTKEYKLITWARVFGKNQHTTGNIYVYSINNKLIGRYALGGSQDLPYKLSSSLLYFSNKEKTDCDTNLKTIIDFSKGLPNELFLKCKGEFGDFYSFSLN